MHKLLLASIAAFMLAGANALSPHEALINVLREIGRLDDASVIAVSYWASAWTPQAPEPVMSQLDQVEADIVGLPGPEKDGVLTWLNHNGRARLYALGIADADIPCKPFIDPKLCASPAGGHSAPAPGAGQPLALYRELAFTALAPASNQSGVVITGGFAAIASGALTHCLSFRVQGGKMASAVTFTYRALTGSGEVVLAGSDIRTGSFAPGSQVPAPSSYAQFQAAGGSSAATAGNCWTRSASPAEPAAGQATTFQIQIASVTYEDGSHWSL